MALYSGTREIVIDIWTDVTDRTYCIMFAYVNINTVILNLFITATRTKRDNYIYLWI